jgi:cysteine-rich repeat protein
MDGRTHCTALLGCVLALSVTCLAACYKSETATCASGRVCPSGLKCSLTGDTCIADQCGDGIRQQAGERCDDGNTQSGDGCSSDCLSLEICGDGVKNEDEACDDGNRDSGDGCSADCRSDETCGNSIVDFAAGEVCDDGGKQGGDGCSADCKSLEVCGNGIQELDEACDSQDRKVCSPNCRPIESCRNGMLEAGEECDDGNDVNKDTCRNDCTAAKCGDGILDPGEVCDPGAGGSASCTSECKPSSCGDGVVNTRASEQCDTRGESAFCTKKCKFSWCGDGEVNPAAGETCEPPLTFSCSAQCKLRDGQCGDGKRDNSFEACDDGNADACGTCSAQCLQVQEPAKAEGTLTLGGPIAGIQDGWRFSISDGYVLKVFEFDRAPDPGEYTSGHIRVYLGADETAESVAARITNLINFDQVSRLVIKANLQGCSAATCTVKLENEEAGAVGNHPIRIGPLPEDNALGTYLKVAGMSGGQAWDCSRGVECSQDRDCLRGLSCTGSGNKKCCGGCGP